MDISKKCRIFANKKNAHDLMCLLNYKDMIVNTHYAPLQPPYPVIYCNGEVAMQIATLIVVEGPEPASANYRRPVGNRVPPAMMPYSIRTHSHPVVSYSNKSVGLVLGPARPNDFSEGVVWDKVELGDIIVLFHAFPGENVSQNLPPNPQWEQVAHDNLSLRIGSLVQQERTKELFSKNPSFSLNALLRGLRRFGPGADLQIVAPKGTMCLHVATSEKEDDFVGTWPRSKQIPWLHIAVKLQDDPDATTELIKYQIEDFLNAVKADREQTDILFRDPEFIPEQNEGDPRIQPLIERLNAIYHKQNNPSK